MSVLRISLFGEMRITLDDRPIVTNMTRTTQALLAYLLLLPHHPHSRDVLADIFWGDRNQEQARRCLNTSLWRLRRVLEPEGILPGSYLLTAPNSDIGFNWQSNHWLDVTAFDHAAQRALGQPIEYLQSEGVQSLEAAVSLYTGELLEGFYDNWALRERERLRQVYLNSLALLMKTLRRQGLFERSLENGRKILELDPLREDVHREMMQIFFESGQRALAIHQYEVCCNLLDTELGIGPMAETQALYAQIAPESDRLRRASLTPGASPDVRHALHQLRSTLRNLDKAHSQLLKTIQLIEKSDLSTGHVERGLKS